MQIVYQLRRNQKFIDQVQKATLTTKEFGIQQTHGLFGSPEWWKNIQTGELKTHVVRGVIHHIYMAQPERLADVRSAKRSGGDIEVDARNARLFVRLSLSSRSKN